MASEYLKRVLHRLLGDYHFWVVYYIDLPRETVDLPDGISVVPLTSETLRSANDRELRSRASFGGPQSQGYGLYVGDELAAVQWYWWGKRYWSEREGRSWILKANDAKSVGLYTVPAYRGRGYATLLKKYTAHEMGERGFRRIYSRIWHSHQHSIAVSRRAGWKKAGSYIEIAPFGRRIKLRIPL